MRVMSACGVAGGLGAGMEPLSANDPRAVGEFQLRARLGAGGMGQVCWAFPLPGGRWPSRSCTRNSPRDREFRQRFGREIAAARAVSGMYTAPVVAAGLDDDLPWFATAYVPVPCSPTWLNGTGRSPEEAVWRLAAGLRRGTARGARLRRGAPRPQACECPARRDGPHVIDFGISRAFEGTSVTAAGMVVGTPRASMSPEQAEGAQAGPPSDVFSLGCCWPTRRRAAPRSAAAARRRSCTGWSPGPT